MRWEVKQKESRTIYSGAENCGRKFRRYAGWTVKDWFENWWIVLKRFGFWEYCRVFGVLC